MVPSGDGPEATLARYRTLRLTVRGARNLPAASAGRPLFCAVTYGAAESRTGLATAPDVEWGHEAEFGVAHAQPSLLATLWGLDADGSPAPGCAGCPVLAPPWSSKCLVKFINGVLHLIVVSKIDEIDPRIYFLFESN